MRISYMAMNRMMEDQLSHEPGLWESLVRQGRGVLADGRAMSDSQLLEYLHLANMEIDRPEFEQLAGCYLSAEEMSRELLKTSRRELGGKEDWVWIALACLWERWLPDQPSLEMIDEKMQLGYRIRAEDEGDVQQACRLWLEVWQDILRVTQRRQLCSLQEFDDLFGGTQSLFNWVQDLETELFNAGRQNPDLFRERMSLCQQLLDRFPNEDKLLRNNFKRALADSYFHVGDQVRGDRLYAEWLAEDPKWGWGWIGWSDSYFLFASGEQDVVRAEQLLKQGLDTPDVEDRAELLDRIQELYEGSGRNDEAEAVRQEIQRLPPVKETSSVTTTDAGMQLKTTLDFGEEEIPLDEFGALQASLKRRLHSSTGQTSASADVGTHRVGRNAPCPCGSGKKFKKCCGRR